MMEWPDDSASEVARLQRCMNDLVSVQALSSIWAGAEEPHIVQTLLDTLLRMLRLDFVYARINDPGGAAIEMVRVAEACELPPRPKEVADTLRRWLGADPATWSPAVHARFGDGGISFVPSRLGVQKEDGVLVAAARRDRFPDRTEALLLNVAINQALIGLQEAKLRNEQKRAAQELDRRVAQRTAELAGANEELKKEIAVRKLTEERLRKNESALSEAHTQIARSEERWRSVFENSAIGVALADLDGRFIATNPVYQKMLGYDDEELCKLSFSDITHDGQLDLSRALVGELLNGTRKQFQIQTQYRCKDGRLVWVRNNLSIVPGSERVPRFLMVLSEDIAESKQAEQARAELAHVARVLSMGALTASIAHEVNQPLAGIITNASTCLRMLGSEPPNVEGARETARRTIRDGNRASEVIARLRALYAKKDAAFEPLDLNETVREVVALQLNELQQRRVTVRVDLAGDIPPVRGDRVQLQQVVLNLLRNASDAMSGVEDRPRSVLVRTVREQAGRACLSVTDAGVGLDPQAAEKLFEMFYTTKKDGMGIGLHVSRSIIESHRGRLWATPNDGPGATFSFSIPCQTDT
jgi:PAS domain S-box-containing protein